MDAEKVAAGLTEARRAALLNLRADGRTGSTRGNGAARRLRTMPNLVAPRWGGDCFRYDLTPLGLEVRRILERQKP